MNCVTREDLPNLEQNRQYETEDYGIFVLDESNRMDREKTKKGAKYRILKESLKEHGQIRPVTINRDGRVLAGQTRVDALNENSMPVKFTVVDLSSEESIITMIADGLSDQWKAVDVANAWAESREAYKKILEAVTVHGIPISYLAPMVRAIDGVTINLTSYDFYYGKQKSFNLDKVVAECDELISVIKLKKFNGVRPLINIFMWLRKERGVEEANSIFAKVRKKVSRRTVSKVSTPETLLEFYKMTGIEAPVSLSHK